MFLRLTESDAREVMESGDTFSLVRHSKFKSYPDVHYIALAEGEKSPHRVYMMGFGSRRWAMLNYIENAWVMECHGYMDDLTYCTHWRRDAEFEVLCSNWKTEVRLILNDYANNQNGFSFPYIAGVHPTVAKLIKDFELKAKLRVRITQKVSRPVGDYQSVVGRLPHSASTYNTFMMRYQTALKLHDDELEIYYPAEDRWIGNRSKKNYARDICLISMKELRITE